jgi:hypothetical protein
MKHPMFLLIPGKYSFNETYTPAQLWASSEEHQTMGSKFHEGLVQFLRLTFTALLNCTK